MSLETWKAEFYPIPADKVKKKDTLEHSLRKWEGLRKENLEKHGVKLSGPMLTGLDGLGYMLIASESCALCVMAEKEAIGEMRPPRANASYCGKCPLYQLDKTSCDFMEGNPYNALTRAGNPEPMISLITRAIEEKAKVSEKRRMARRVKKTLDIPEKM